MKITLVRHGETTHNASRTWQGHAEGTLSDTGKQQAALAGTRLGSHEYDLVVASDLGRALESAELMGLRPDVDPQWREIDVGSWAGRTHADVAETDGDQLAALRRGDDVRLGGGETITGFGTRMATALETLGERLVADFGDEGSALVVTHGGVIMSLVNRLWQLPFGPDNPTAPIANTAFTTLEFGYGRWRVDTFNDAVHLGRSAGFAAERAAEGDAVITLVRHGETDANVQGLWQGQTDWGLNTVGRAQADRLAAWYEPGGPVYASPLGRAAQTASALNGHTPVLVDGLKEIFMGSWEGLDSDAIKAGWPELWERTFEHHEDLKRGGDGESVAELMHRVRSTVDELIARHRNGRMTVVSHGSAIRAFVVSVLGGGNEVFRSTGLLPNTGLANVVMTERGYRLADYGIAPHLG